MATEGCEFALCSLKGSPPLSLKTVFFSFSFTESADLPPGVEQVSERPAGASLSGRLQPPGPAPALVLPLKMPASTTAASSPLCS